MLEITGIEADYDGERVTFDQAQETLSLAGLEALLYTSPSHTAEKPRWRVLCPTSRPLPPACRPQLLGRLNGLFKGAFSFESWTLSQSFYFGSVSGNPAHQVELTDGVTIDQLDELDATWIGKPDAEVAAGGDASSRGAPFDEAKLLSNISCGANYHVSVIRLIGRWAFDGVPMMESRRRLETAFDEVPPPDKETPRWKARRADIDRCLLDIYVKQAKKRDDGGAGLYPSERHGRGAAEQAPGSARAAAHLKWPQPLDFLTDHDQPPPILGERHLPPALFPFVQDTAERMGVDPVSVALACIVSCAAVVSDDWRVQPKRHDYTWTESPRLWGAIVGSPSILKTPIISACTNPIDKLDAEARRRHAEAMRLYKQRVKEAKADPNAPEPVYPRLDRYLVEGATVEAISEVLREDGDAKQRAPARKVLCRHDEMAEFFGSLDRYKAGGKGGSDRGAYLRLFNGGSYTVDRIGRGSFSVSNWSACYLGGIQPGPIQKIAKDTAEDGLLQRFLYAVPGTQTSGEDRPPSAAALARYEALFPALSSLHPPRVSGGQHAHRVVFHAEAHQHREKVLKMAEAMTRMPDTSARLQAAFGKWPGIYARIALTFHLIEAADARARGGIGPSTLVITEDIARRGAAFMLEIALPHLLRADAVMYSTTQTGHGKWIAGHILAHKLDRITTRDVVRAYGPLRSPECKGELEAVMASLVTIGWLEPEQPANPVKPVSAWGVNPAVHVLFGERATLERERRDRSGREIAEALEMLRTEAGNKQ